MSLKHYSFTIRFISLLQICTSVVATCNTFIPSSTLQFQLNQPTYNYSYGQISKPLHCPTGKPNNFYSCRNEEDGTRGCEISPHTLMGLDGLLGGDLGITAPLNVQRELFSLVNAQIRKYNRNEQIYDHLLDCITPHNTGGALYSDCVPEGKTAYISATRPMYCANGSVENCMGKGPLKDGKHVKVCGPKLLSGRYHDQNPIMRLYTKLVYIDKYDISEHESYPGLNKQSSRECQKILNSNTAARYGISRMLLKPWLALGVCYIMLF